MSRDLDLVVFGATSFAGRYLVEYLQRAAPPSLRWAIAGRSPAKLDRLRAELGLDLPVIVADSADRASLDAMVARTRVVCTTVGPYARYGAELVAACVEAGVHTADLTGEPPFMRRMIDAHHARAQQTGSRVVHAAGFDSIPSDLGLLCLQEEAIARTGRPCDQVELAVMRVRGGFSGGTVASMAALFEDAGDRDVRRALADPYSLCSERGPDRRELRGVRWSPSVEAWTGPFLMAGTNERVVRRSNELLGFRYGRDLRYHEVSRMGRGLRGWVRAAGMAAGLGAGVAVMAWGPTRRLARSRLPAPGEGPSREAVEGGGFHLRLVGWQGDARVAQVDVHADRDPGYGATAIMLGETGLALVDGPQGEPGVTTPAAALGRPLVERLNRAGVTFTVG